MQPAAQKTEQDASHGDKAELVRLADLTVGKLRKVDAAFKIDATGDAIAANLIEAQAQYDELSAFKSPVDISGLRDRLEVALAGFKKARTSTGQSRADALAESRSALTSAAEMVAALKAGPK